MATTEDTALPDSRPADGRVAAIHSQTRRGLVMTAVFMAAAVVAAVVRIGDGWWIPLHLFVVGALLTAISVVTQMLAVTWSSSPAPPPTVSAAQRWLLAVGTIVLVIGRDTGRTWLFATGGVAVALAMLGLIAILIDIRRRAMTPRFAAAIDAYIAAVLAGLVGMSIGILRGTGHGDSRALELRDVHLTLNVFGLIGLVIAGTLPFFAATQVRSKMSRRATPVAMRTTTIVLAAGTAVAAIGHLVSAPTMVAVGLTSYALGLLAIGAMLPGYTRRSLSWAGPRIAQLAVGLVWWMAMTLALAFTGLRGTDDRAVLQALLIGGFAQILVASLAYLGPVLRGGGHRRLTAGFAITRSWTSLAAGNAAAVAALAGWHRALAVALIIWLVDIAFRAGRLVAATGGYSHV